MEEQKFIVTVVAVKMLCVKLLGRSSVRVDESFHRESLIGSLRIRRGRRRGNVEAGELVDEHLQLVRVDRGRGAGEVAECRRELCL